MGVGTSWRVSGRVLSRDGDVFSVQIDWQRQLDHGVRVESPGVSSTQTMRLGDRLVLDIVTPTAPSCGVVIGRLEAAMLVKTVYPKLPPGAGINVGMGVEVEEAVGAAVSVAA
jgi:hypothetical protein